MSSAIICDGPNCGSVFSMSGKFNWVHVNDIQVHDTVVSDGMSERIFPAEQAAPRIGDFCSLACAGLKMATK